MITTEDLQNHVFEAPAAPTVDAGLAGEMARPLDQLSKLDCSDTSMKALDEMFLERVVCEFRYLFSKNALLCCEQTVLKIGLAISLPRW